MILTIIVFFLVLNLLVFVHEFGHFITAKKSGMKVYEFALGFPPRACGCYRDPKTGKLVWVWGRGDSKLKETFAGHEQEQEFPATLYSFNWLPLGGYVRIKGENGAHATEKDSFGAQSTWKQIVVLVAGVTMNFVLAAVLLGAGFMVGLPADVSMLEDKHAIIVGEPKVAIQQVEKDSPAEEAGISFGDHVLAINDVQMKSTSQMVEYVHKNGDGSLSIDLMRGEESRTVEVMPRMLDDGDVARIGVSLADAAIIKYPAHIAMIKGVDAAWNMSIMITKSFGILIKDLVLGKGLAFDVAGPVGIASIVGQSMRLGITHLINVTAMISLSLAVINIMPIPALDGGRILFILLGKIFKKKAIIAYEQMAHTLGFLLLMGLIVIITIRDVIRLF